MNVPIDQFIRNDWTKFPPGMIIQSATPKVLEECYEKQLQNSKYQDFLQKTNATIFGTLDDHDMGCNNADSTFEYKTESALAFLHFTGETYLSPVYQRAQLGYGVYGVKLFDFNSNHTNYLVPDMDAAIDPDILEDVDRYNDMTQGKDDHRRNYSNHSVAIFFLDVRTHRTPWGKGLKGWTPNYDGDFLGERQWQWLEKAVLRSQASVNIFVQGLQVHPYRFPDANFAEVWAQFPRARQRLYDTILASENIKAPILVSGDVHMAQFMRKDCVKYDERYNPQTPRKPFIEVTTSGMTHSWGTCFFSSERMHKSWKRFYYHFISQTFMSLSHLLLPMPDLMRADLSSVPSGNPQQQRRRKLYENGGGEGSMQGKQYALGLNVGEFEFDWEDHTLTVRILGDKLNAPPLLSGTWTFEQLSAIEPLPGSLANVHLTEKYGRYQMDRFVEPGKYMCMNHRHPASIYHVLSGYLAMTLVMLLLSFGPYILLTWLIIRYGILNKKKEMMLQIRGANTPDNNQVP